MNRTPNKSLRRKPPPPIDDNIINDNPNGSFSQPSGSLLETPYSIYEPRSSPVSKPISPPQIDTSGYRKYSEMVLDEQQIINMETPKPMGPRDFPDYDDMPYSLSQPLDNDEYDPFGDSTVKVRTTTDIVNQSLITPSKIPSLGIETSLSLNGNYQTETPISSHRFSPNSETISGSPSPIRLNSIESPSILTSDNSFRRSPLSVPYKSRTTPSRMTYSRSPSPKKLYGRSPSLVYRISDKDQEYAEEYDDYDYEIDDSSVFLEGTNDQQYYDDELEESPTFKSFNFSMLPNLPPSEDALPDESAKRTLYSTASLTRLSTVRKNDDLPPVPLDLPNLPFSSSSLISQHFEVCDNVWAMSKIFAWCLKLKLWLHNLFISKKEFKKALIKLLVYHRQDVPLETLICNVTQVISSFHNCGAITFNYGTLPDKDGLKALPEPGYMSGYNSGEAIALKDAPGIEINENACVNGVLIDMTPCYSYETDHHKLQVSGTKLTCFSSRCFINRILDYETKFKNTDIGDIVLGDDWASHWKLSAEDIKGFDKAMAKRQSLIFDLLRYEQTFIQRAKVFVDIVAPEFVKVVKGIINSLEIILIGNFDEDIVNPGKQILTIHQNSLFEPLLKILISNGKFIKDIIDIAQIYYNWSQVVKPALLNYMTTMPMIEELLTIPLIKAWVDTKVRELPNVKNLRVNGSLLFLSTFNSRYQLLPLQLADIRALFDEEDSESKYLTKAIDGIRNISNKINEVKHHADNMHNLKRIRKQLVWKNNIAKININFESENRRFFYRGDLTKKGDLKINSSVNHIILLDNYLLITEKIKSNRTHMVNYRILDNPIPIEFLLVELKDKETPLELKNIANLTQLLPQQEVQEDPSIYPFKIRYAGQGKNSSFTFSTKTERERSVWVDYLLKARSNLCKRLSKVEPFQLKVISNTCFGYEESNRMVKLQLLGEYDPIEPMARNSLKVLQDLGYKENDISQFHSTNHIVFSTILSGTNFIYRTTNFYFIGTVSGVYCTDMNYQWKRIILIQNTTKISVLPLMNIVITLSGGYLRYYPLDMLIRYFYGQGDSISTLALSKDIVSFFEIGIHREITMLFYAKKKASSGSTSFKVCIPETDNDGIVSCFKPIKEFNVQGECYGLSIFNSTFAVHTHKGFEVLDLGKLSPRSIPEFPANDKRVDGYNRRTNDDNTMELELIRKSINFTGSKPLGIFKLNNNNEFILVYNECAIFINKHGKLSRFSILRFDYRCKSIRFDDNRLFIVCDEAIEIWSISDFVNGTNRLIQVLIGKDIRIVGENEIIVCMANPVIPGLQLVLSLHEK